MRKLRLRGPLQGLIDKVVALSKGIKGLWTIGYIGGIIAISSLTITFLFVNATLAGIFGGSLVTFVFAGFIMFNLHLWKHPENFDGPDNGGGNGRSKSKPKQLTKRKASIKKREPVAIDTGPELSQNQLVRLLPQIREMDDGNLSIEPKETIDIFQRKSKKNDLGDLKLDLKRIELLKMKSENNFELIYKPNYLIDPELKLSKAKLTRNKFFEVRTRVEIIKRGNLQHLIDKQLKYAGKNLALLDSIPIGNFASSQLKSKTKEKYHELNSQSISINRQLIAESSMLHFNQPFTMRSEYLEFIEVVSLN